MKPPFLWLLLLSCAALADPPGVAAPSGCHDDFSNCKETCTLEYGTNQSARNQFSRCLGKCDAARDLCIERYLEVNSNQLAPSAVEHDRGGRDEVKSDPTPHASESRTRYEPEPESQAPPPKPAAAEPQLKAAPAAEPASAPPAPAPVAAKPATPAPAKKPPKKDLSEWDPNDLK